MSTVNNNQQNAINNVQNSQTQATQQATSADNKNIQDFNKLLNGKKTDPATLALFQKSEKMLSHKAGFLKVEQSSEKAFTQKQSDLDPSLFKQSSKDDNMQKPQSFASTDTGTDKFINQNKENQKNDSMPSADQLVASLNQQQNLGQNQQPQNVASTQNTSQSLSNINVQEIADRILVATNKDGSNEVRLLLSDKALQGTEVIVNKSLDNVLTVRFETTNANSFQTLVAAQDLLKSNLLTSNSEVKVEVSQQSSGDQQGESKGKQNYNPFEDNEQA